MVGTKRSLGILERCERFAKKKDGHGIICCSRCSLYSFPSERHFHGRSFLLDEKNENQVVLTVMHAFHC